MSAPMIELRTLAQALGGEIVGRNAVLAPGPGHSRRDRSLSVRLEPDAPGGFVVYSHAGDDVMGCKDYIRERCGLPRWQSRGLIANPRGGLRVDEKPTLASQGIDKNTVLPALSIWSASVEPAGTVVERYLASRSLELPPDAADVLRFHPRLRYYGGTVPGMVALLRDIRTNEPAGIHRTYLTANGVKLGRKMLGRAKGAAIKIDPDEDVTLGLTIGEGIETVLAARQLGFRPAWALGSVGAVEAFPALPAIEALTILEEAGAPSIKAVERCGRTWSEAGAEVIVVAPKVGSDINDSLRGVAA